MHAPPVPSAIDPIRLFRASCVALGLTAMSFALRGEASAAWVTDFHLTHEQVGWVNGAAFWGFALAMLFGGPMCDWLGLGRIVGIAFAGHLAGILLTACAWNYGSLLAGTLIFGLANGAVEAAGNPLVATIYSGNKTEKLNQFHVWFPGGIVIGGLFAYCCGGAGLGWRWQFAALLLPLAIYGAMFFRRSFPRTERVQQGVSTAAMFAACLRPAFLVLVICMLLTSATELGPSQWIPSILSHAGVSGILVLVWITGLMAVGRQFAGALVHRLSPLGMLLASSVLSAGGLYAMSQVSGTTLFAAATLFAIGVCFFWPTMLGYVNETFPRTGALGLAIMGGAGVLSVSLVLPAMGRVFDSGISSRLSAGATLEALPESQRMAVQAAAGLETLGRVAVLPIGLAVVFAILLVLDRRPGAAAGAPAN